MAKSAISKSLRAIALALDELEQHEIDLLIAGRGRLIFIHGEKPIFKQEVPDFDVPALLDRLDRCETRDDAQRILSDVEGKDRIVLIAKALKVHVVKNDRREDIESKIIAFAIGRKLRTEAIQSLNMRGGNDGTGTDA